MSGTSRLSERSARRIGRQVKDRERQSQAEPIRPRGAGAPGVAYPFVAVAGAGGIAAGGSGQATIQRFDASGTLVNAETITVHNVATGTGNGVSGGATIVCVYCQGESGLYPVVIFEMCPADPEE